MRRHSIHYFLTQPIAGSAWRLRARCRLKATGGATIEIGARDSSTGRQCVGGILINGGPTPLFWDPYYTSDSAFVSYTATPAMPSPPWIASVAETETFWIELELVSATVVSRYSLSGYDKTFITATTLPLSTNSQTVVDSLSLRFDGLADTIAIVDSFRRYA